MDAIKLADSLQLEKARSLSYVAVVVDSAVMLRQQADKIADLETTIKFLQEECVALRSQLNEVSN